MLAVFALLAAVIGAIYGLVHLFTPDYAKVTPRTLSRSLIRATEGREQKPQPCTRLGRTWNCSVAGSAGSGRSARYRVTMTDAHCWRAVKTLPETFGEALPARTDGCVTSEDVPD
jgi:hypothetical protein